MKTKLMSPMFRFCQSLDGLHSPIIRSPSFSFALLFTIHLLVTLISYHSLVSNYVALPRYYTDRRKIVSISFIFPIRIDFTVFFIVYSSNWSAFSNEITEDCCWLMVLEHSVALFVNIQLGKLHCIATLRCVESTLSIKWILGIFFSVSSFRFR